MDETTYHINNEITLTEEKLATLKLAKSLQEAGYQTDVTFIENEIQKDKDARTALIESLVNEKQEKDTIIATITAEKEALALEVEELKKPKGEVTPVE